MREKRNMWWDFFARIFAPPPEVSAFDEVKVGRMVLVGEVAPGNDTLLSPIRKTPCVAFYYQSSWRAPSRGSTTTRTFAQAEMYVPSFRILMAPGPVAGTGGALVEVLGSRGTTYTPAEHQAAVAAELNGFEAMEQVIKAGDRVKVLGRVQAVGDGFRIQQTRIEVIGGRPVIVTSSKKTVDRRGT